LSPQSQQSLGALQPKPRATDQAGGTMLKWPDTHCQCQRLPGYGQLQGHLILDFFIQGFPPKELDGNQSLVVFICVCTNQAGSQASELAFASALSQSNSAPGRAAAELSTGSWALERTTCPTRSRELAAGNAVPSRLGPKG